MQYPFRARRVTLHFSQPKRYIRRRCGQFCALLPVYLAKKRSIREYLEGKLSRILTCPQLSLLKKKQTDRQLAERQIRKKMKGASKEELQLALLEMEK